MKKSLEINIETLSALLKLLKENGVTEYEHDSFKLKINPYHGDINKKDISINKKTKEQESEDLLFHSSIR